jgi:hypothetical protein
MLLPVIEQLLGVLDDGNGIGADDARETGFGGLRTLSCLAYHEHGDAKRRRFFLNASGVRDDQVSAAHQRKKRQIVERGE